VIGGAVFTARLPDGWWRAVLRAFISAKFPRGMASPFSTPLFF
jgi:hypothetical protein